MGGTQLVPLPPPAPPGDLIPAALFVPLSSVGEGHRGRKLRLIGQILAYHAETTLLLISSHPARQGAPYPTLLVNLSIPLMGQSPSVKDVSSAQDGLYSRQTTTYSIALADDDDGRTKMNGNPYVNRLPLKLDRGGWVCIVGWLEGDGSRLVRKVKTSSTYAKPLPIILEAIHISPSREPPVGAMFRGDMPPAKGIATLDFQTSISCSSATLPLRPTRLDPSHEITPRAKRPRRAN